MKNILFLFLLLLVCSIIVLACSNQPKVPKTKAEVATAIVKNDVVAISLWLKNGGNPNELLEHGRSPLYIANGPKGGMEVMKLLLENGADVNLGAGKYTPLMNAASWVNLDAVKLLLEKGADRTLTNEEGKTAFEVIGDCGGCSKYEKVKALLNI